jgi:hypothetical protein
MSFQGKVFAGQAIVFLTAAVIYIAGGGSIAGFIMLASAVLFGVWTAVFLLRRPETEAGPPGGVVGRFPVGTTRAPLLAAAVVLLGNGLVVGWWMAASAGVVLLVAAVLYFFEYLDVVEAPERDID